MLRYRDFGFVNDKVEEEPEEIQEFSEEPLEDAPIGEAEEIILNEDDTQEI